MLRFIVTLICLGCTTSSRAESSGRTENVGQPPGRQHLCVRFLFLSQSYRAVRLNLFSRASPSSPRWNYNFQVATHQAADGSRTPNIAGLGGKVLTQVISRYYYPPGAADFSVLATKFGYSIMREVAFSSIREFYPDIAAHYIRKHREKATRLAARDAAFVP